jgi:hypothetical protein
MNPEMVLDAPRDDGNAPLCSTGIFSGDVNGNFNATYLAYLPFTPMNQGQVPGFDPKPVRVLYVAGHGRSGSTIFTQTLEQAEGVLSVGEFIAAIWIYGLVDNRLCGCGVPLRECSFWTEVFERAFGGWESPSLDVDEMVGLWLQVARFQNIPQIISRSRSFAFETALQSYTAYLETLYRAIQSVSGAEVIVDSSKSPTYAYILDTMKSIDLRVAHLVRDSRAVAFSMLREKLRPEFTDKSQYLEQSHPFKTAFKWMAYNLALVSIAKKYKERYLLTRYEDFVANPPRTFESIWHLAGIEKCTPIPQLGHQIQLGINHQINGNPVRFNRGQVTLNADNEWKAKMNPTDKFIITALTLPLLKHYGYL